MNIRFVGTTLDICLEPIEGKNSELFRKEYQVLSDFEEDLVGQWLRQAKAKGETADSDEVVIKLLVELHKKVDMLTDIIKEEERTLLELQYQNRIDGVGFDFLRFEEGMLVEEKEYYCRISMPVFPKREMPMFIKALDSHIAQIVLIHEKDQKDWNAYVTSRERIEIREKKVER